MTGWIILQWLIAHVELLIGFMVGIVLIAHVLTQKRSPSGTIAWLLAIILIPYIGVPLYLMLGGRKMKRTAAKKSATSLSRPSRRLDVPRTQVDELLESYGIPNATDGNRLEFLTDGQQIYHNLISLIDNAQHSIYISTFIFRPDEVGKEIRDRLVLKARQGLDVRVLLDGFGAIQTGRRFFVPLAEAGGKYAFFMHRLFRGRTNLRNHRKIIIVDNQTVLAGGANIGKEYLGPEPDPKRWQDLSFILKGPAVRSYLEIFHSDWAFTIGTDDVPAQAEPAGYYDSPNVAIVQVVPSGPDIPGDPLYDAILTSLYNARHNIQIITPYFIPDEPLLYALQLAVRRGVQVKIIVPAKSNHMIADIVRRIYLREMLRVGAEIFFYTPTMIHAKTILVDDTLVMIGSANMDSRSLFLNYEVMLITYSRPQITQIQTWMARIEKACIHCELKAGFMRILFEHVIRLFSPLL
jgi:cardiolipin synthase